MKFLEEYRDGRMAKALLSKIEKETNGDWTLMEVCGGQSHTIIKYGLDQLLPPSIEMIHGPGCPVCVTPTEIIDQALEIASCPEVTFCSFGDMLRVPGSRGDLLNVKAAGGDVRVVYSPLDAVSLARRLKDRQVVFFAVGFETTAPTTAMAVWRAKQLGLDNFSLLVAHVRVPPAITALLSDGSSRIQGFLAAGHVCTVMGYEEYEPIVARYGIPIVVTGFEPVDILQGVLMCVRQLEEGRAEVENQYSRSVRREGNIPAKELMAEVFETVERSWRGLGVISDSGLKLRGDYEALDAVRRFSPETSSVEDAKVCIAGLVLQGKKKPPECPAFGSLCTPEMPHGAPMVSSEGACAAYYAYRTGGIVSG
ncbi:MAG: hydrogenase formation protein HypD [Thermoplasmata archaeon]